MEIEIPEEFYVVECPICGQEHAPIRRCPEVEDDGKSQELHAL